jgi:hypothetical protein
VGESEGSHAPGEFFFPFFPFGGGESAALAKMLQKKTGKKAQKIG